MRKLLRKQVLLVDFSQPISLSLIGEMVLQELERTGGECRTGYLAHAAGVPEKDATDALRLLRMCGLAKPAQQNTWVPMRDREKSPYAFNTDDSGTIYEPPPRIDFKQAIRDERARESRKHTEAVTTKTQKRNAPDSLVKRGRGRPRKTRTTLRGFWD